MTNRRLFLQMGPTAIATFTLIACSQSRQTSPFNTSPSNTSPSNTSPSNTSPSNTSSSNTQKQARSPTPSCAGNEATPPQTAGPFYTPESPERTSLREPGITGTPMVLTGQVLSSSCEPIANALLDFWHTDDQGQYDNTGYKLRGHQFTDAQGRYRLETMIPGIYPGRTRHFHVKVQAPNSSPLTTQLYFPEETLNNRDGLFQPELLISLDSAQITEQSEKQAVFDFVLRAAS